MLISVIRGYLYSLFKIERSGFLSVAKGVTIIGKKLTTKNRCKIEENVFIQTIAKDGIYLDEGSTVCFGALIRPSSHWGGEIGEGLVLGKNSSIGAYSYIGCSGKICIGSNVLIGPSVSLIAENHVFSDLNKSIKEQGVIRRGIKIEDDVWIGTRAVILDGVSIGRGSVVAAGAIVVKDVAPYSVVGGVPARLLRKRQDDQ